MTDFYTTALESDTEDIFEDFQWVFCSQATRVVKPDGSAVETYKCELSGFDQDALDTGDPPGMGANVFGEIDYPTSAVRFTDDTGFFYFSDFLFFTTGEVCFAETWHEQLTPSGQVNMKATYSPGGCVAP